MKAIGKKIGTLLMSVILILGFSLNVMAQDLDENNESADGSSFITENFSENVVENPLKGNILNKGVASIGNNGNGSVNVSGTVFGSVVCDKLTLKMTLQRYFNGYWKDVKSFSNTAYNTSYLTKSYDVSVTKGYYYRVKAACFATKGSTSESKSPVTDGIWID